MSDGWYALTLAIMAPVDLTVEDAFSSLEKGRIVRRKHLETSELQNMVKMQKEGATWQEIGACYGLDKKTAFAAVKRYRKQKSAPLVGSVGQLAFAF